MADAARAIGGQTTATGHRADPVDPIVDYTVRALRGASFASALLIAIIAIYVALPGNQIGNTTGIAVLLAVAAAMTAGTAFVPWQRVVSRPHGLVAVWAWAAGAVAIVEAGIATTGGGRSELYLLLMCILCFLAGPAYPIIVEVALSAATILAYPIAVEAGGGGITTATLGYRVGILVATAFAIGFLANEASRGIRRQIAERTASEQRQVMWQRVAALVPQIDAPAIGEVLSAVVEALQDVGFDAADICEVDQQAGTYRVLESWGLPDDYVSASHSLEGGVVGMVMERHCTVVVDDYAMTHAILPSLRNADFGTVIAGPIWVEGAIAAVLEAGTQGRRPIGPEEVAAFDTFAVETGHALERARVLERERADSDAFRRLLASSPDAVMVADLSGRVLRASDRAAALFGIPAAELVGMEARQLMPEAVREDQMTLIDEWLDGEGAGVIGTDSSAYVLHRDGREIPVEARFSTVETPEGPVITASIRDISERREFERRLAHQATHDQLTGLPNRQLFQQQLARMLAERTPVTPPVTVCLLDLDHFKYMNDSRGHDVGDRLVAAVAERLARQVGGHLLARVGGDEFGLLAEGPTVEETAMAFAEGVLAAFGEPFEVDGVACYMQASMGVAFGQQGDRAEDVLRNADAAMYRAKRDGRGHVEFFDEQLTVEAAERIAVEAALHLALERHEFELVYQPVVSLLDRRVIGMEALVRWRHPDEGVISPARFIPIAEETGLIIPMGRQVLSMACGQLAEWQQGVDRLPDLTLSVNVSARQLEQDRLVEDVASVLDETGIDPDLLVLEITESVFMHDLQAVVRRLHDLRSLGVQLAIDDFGTGFSSLFSLSRLPVDVVKIHKAFVDGLGTRNDSVVSAVVTLGDAFDLKVVAEGIERQEQRDRLVELGCRFAQGYFFARPLAVADATSLLRSISEDVSPTSRSSALPG